jgi:hypothetical protein
MVYISTRVWLTLHQCFYLLTDFHHIYHLNFIFYFHKKLDNIKFAQEKLFYIIWPFTSQLISCLWKVKMMITRPNWTDEYNLMSNILVSMTQMWSMSTTPEYYGTGLACALSLRPDMRQPSDGFPRPPAYDLKKIKKIPDGIRSYPLLRRGTHAFLRRKPELGQSMGLDAEGDEVATLTSAVRRSSCPRSVLADCYVCHICNKIPAEE